MPGRRDQSILITKNDRKDHGREARKLAIRVCSHMIDWLRKLPQSSRIEKRHWEHDSYGLHHASKYSIFMELTPADVHEDPHSDILDRELAYFAMEEYRNMLSVYGAMQGEWELYAVNLKRATIAIYIVEWPPEHIQVKGRDSR